MQTLCETGAEPLSRPGACHHTARAVTTLSSPASDTPGSTHRHARFSELTNGVQGSDQSAGLNADISHRQCVTNHGWPEVVVLAASLRQEQRQRRHRQPAHMTGVCRSRVIGGLCHHARCCLCTGGAFDVSPAALKGVREFMSRGCNLGALQVPLARLVALLPLHCPAHDGAQSQW